MGKEGYLRDASNIFARLDAEYEPSDLGNKENPLDELVFIVLLVKTPEHRYHRAYERVRNLVGDWRNLLEVEGSDLRAAIGDAGLSSAKARVLKAVAASLQERLGEVSLRCVINMDTTSAERFLKSLPGVGVKVAKCVVMYSLDRPVFPVDTHCFRVGSRLGWFPRARSEPTPDCRRWRTPCRNACGGIYTSGWFSTAGQCASQSNRNANGVL